MDSFFVAAKSVLPLFFIIIVGLGFSRTKAASVAWVDVLNKYALWIGFPALVFSSLAKLDFQVGEYSSLIISNSIFIVACMLLAYPVSRIFRLSNRVKRTLFLLLSFGNVAYLGIPVLVSSMGEGVLPVAAIISALYVFWLLTIGIILVEINGPEKMSVTRLLKSLATNPLLLSVIFGMLASIFKIWPGGLVMRTVDFFSQSVTAVVLFSLGIFLGLQKIGSVKEWVPVFWLTVVTTIVLPAFFYFALKGFILPNEQFRSSIIDAAMPLGLTPYALSVQYKLEAKLAARLVVMATALSVIILPLWIVITGK
jgi:predicted permease